MDNHKDVYAYMNSKINKKNSETSYNKIEMIIICTLASMTSGVIGLLIGGIQI